MEAAGVPKYNGYVLAITMLDYWTAQILEQRKANHTALRTKKAWSSLKAFCIESMLNLLSVTWFIWLIIFMLAVTVLLLVNLGIIIAKGSV